MARERPAETKTDPKKTRQTSRTRKREETARRIVKAARRTFAQRGFHGASTRDIASEAGTNQGLITYHFGTKDALWRAAADSLFEELGGRLTERINVNRSPDKRENARESIREFVRFSAEHPEFFWLMVDEGKSADERLAWLVESHLRPRFNAITEYLLRESDYSEEDLPHAFYALAGAANLIFAVAPECRQLTGIDPMKKAAVERHADLVARLIVP